MSVLGAQCIIEHPTIYEVVQVFVEVFGECMQSSSGRLVGVCLTDIHQLVSFWNSQAIIRNMFLHVLASHTTYEGVSRDQGNTIPTTSVYIYIHVVHSPIPINNPSKTPETLNRKP